MTSGSFEAQSQAIAGAASAFDAQADPIIRQAERLRAAQGTATTTGRDYSAQGSAYYQALTGPLEKIIRSFGEKCVYVSTNLQASAKDYTSADAAGSAGLQASGGRELR
jgi:hypothetical protein